MCKVLNKNCFVQKFQALPSHCKDPSSFFTPRPKREVVSLSVWVLGRQQLWIRNKGERRDSCIFYAKRMQLGKNCYFYMPVSPPISASVEHILFCTDGVC